MRHPTDEQWSEFLYDELPPVQKAAIDQHLKGCALCAQKSAEFGRTLKKLDSWEVDVPEKPRLEPEWSPMIKWAAAAALLVSTAFATGRFSKPSLDTELLQARISKPLEERIDRELQSRVQQQVQLATDRALETHLLELQSELAARLQAISEKAASDAAANKEQFALALTALRDRDKTLYSALQEIEAKRFNDNRALREDLEKVALFTDQSLRTTHRQLVQLASFTQNPQ